MTPCSGPALSPAPPAGSVGLDADVTGEVDRERELSRPNPCTEIANSMWSRNALNCGDCAGSCRREARWTRRSRGGRSWTTTWRIAPAAWLAISRVPPVLCAAVQRQEPHGPERSVQTLLDTGEREELGEIHLARLPSLVVNR